MLKLFILALCACACLAKKDYNGYQVIRMQIGDAEQYDVVKFLMDIKGIDFWDFPRDVMVPPQYTEKVKEYLDVNNVLYKVWIHNVQEKIDGASDRAPKTLVDGFDYTVYHPLNEIMDWIAEILVTYPTLATNINIGTSYEGRDLPVLKVGADTGKEKRAVWFNGCIHSREWVSPATVMWMTNQLMKDYTEGTNPDVTFLLETYDFYILTVMNPDGYEFTWTGDRMWRKSRSPNDGYECMGTDMNRNYDFAWDGEGSSDFPCSSTYRGTHPLSEIEVESVVNFIRAQSVTQPFDLFIDYHNYSQKMLSPWGYTYDLPADYPAMYDHMTVHTNAMAAVHGVQYEYGNGSAQLYLVAGGAKDWGYGDRGIIYSYTIELRDEGEYGFLLPESEILPTAQENYAGLVAGLIHISNL